MKEKTNNKCAEKKREKGEEEREREKVVIWKGEEEREMRKEGRNSNSKTGVLGKDGL